MFFKLAWRNIWRNKVRSFITMGLIFLFTMQVIFFQSLKKGTMLSVIDGLAGGYLGYVHVHEKGYWDQPFLDYAMEECDSLDQIVLNEKGIKGVSHRISSGALLSTDTNTFYGSIVGVNIEEEKTVTGLLDNLGEEKDPFRNGGVIVAKGLAENYNIGVGDTIAFTGQGMYGTFAAGLLPVNKIMKINAMEVNSRLIIMDLNLMKSMLSAEGFVSEMIVGIKDKSQAVEMTNQLKSVVDTSKYEVMSWKDLRPEFDQMNELNDAGNVIMAGILYMLVFFGFFGSTLMMLSERNREFGMLISIGMSKISLILTLFYETFIMAIMSGVAAFLIAFPVIYYVQENPIELTGQLKEDYEAYGMEAIMKTVVDPELFAQNAMIVIGLAILVNFLTLFKIGRLKAVEAVKS